MNAHGNGLVAILFDFGGTLDGPGVPWVERFALAYREAGLDISLDRLRDAAGYGTRQSYHTPRVAGFDLRATVAFQVDCQFAHLELNDTAAESVVVDAFLSRTTAALQESRAVLERLARRFTLGVVSNFYGNVARILADAGLAPSLAAIVDSTVVGVSKPDPRVFTLAVERLGVSPAKTLYVGDSLEQDIAPARAAGLRTAWLAGAHAAPGASCADLQVRALDELERLL